MFSRIIQNYWIIFMNTCVCLSPSIFSFKHETVSFTVFCVLQKFFDTKKRQQNKNFYWHWWQEDTRKFDLKQNIFIDWKRLLKRSIIVNWVLHENVQWSLKWRRKINSFAGDYRIDEMKILFYERLHLLYWECPNAPSLHALTEKDYKY